MVQVSDDTTVGTENSPCVKLVSESLEGDL